MSICRIQPQELQCISCLFAFYRVLDLNLVFIEGSPMRYSTPGEDSSYDVIEIGGALSGAATATLLLRQNPSLRLLIIEKSAQLTRRVGEATVEVMWTLEANKRSQYVTATQPKLSGRAVLSTHSVLGRNREGSNGEQLSRYERRNRTANHV
jgi:hypothetical protein